MLHHAVHPALPVTGPPVVILSNVVEHKHRFGQFLAVLNDIPPEGEGCISLNQWRLTPGSAVREGHVG